MSGRPTRQKKAKLANEEESASSNTVMSSRTRSKQDSNKFKAKKDEDRDHDKVNKLHVVSEDKKQNGKEGCETSIISIRKPKNNEPKQVLLSSDKNSAEAKKNQATNGKSNDQKKDSKTNSDRQCTKDCRPGFPNPCPLRGGDSDNLSCVQVHELLHKMGIAKSEETSRCVKAALQNGSITVVGEPADLDTVLATGRADGSDECRHRLKATLCQLLNQSDIGADEYGIDYDGATVCCDKGECVGTTYVTNMCSGSFDFENGKSHNHCRRCPGFGHCIGDAKTRHCSICGDHYFAGRSGQFKCCKGSRGKPGLPNEPDFDEGEDSDELEIGNDSSFEPPWANEISSCEESSDL